MYALQFSLLFSETTVPLTHQKVFLNIVLDEAVEEKAGGEKVRLGMVVIRGNSVVMLEVGPHSRSLVLEDTHANGVFSF